MDFFEWLKKYEEASEKLVAEGYIKALQGRMRNPFEWKAVEKGLDTKFSKAVQKTDITSGGKPIPLLNVLRDNNSSQEDSDPRKED